MPVRGAFEVWNFGKAFLIELKNARERVCSWQISSSLKEHDTHRIGKGCWEGKDRIIDTSKETALFRLSSSAFSRVKQFSRYSFHGIIGGKRRMSNHLHSQKMGMGVRCFCPHPWSSMMLPVSYQFRLGNPCWRIGDMLSCNPTTGIPYWSILQT